MEATQMPAKWVKARMYMAMTGHTKNTMNHARQKGHWIEGKHYKKGVDDVLYYNHIEIDKLIDRA